jgi:putative ubiquitin-RnfH superfamily antitoxin RatB of RatAB toxin-antitoxin module
MIYVEVVYATPEKQTLLIVNVPKKSTVATAILKSKILAQHPELDLETLNVGIFSNPCTLEKTLMVGDRVEIYRPLQNDPKEMRRFKATGIR